jgi:hypothetical protein
MKPLRYRDHNNAAGTDDAAHLPECVFNVGQILDESKSDHGVEDAIQEWES